MSDPAGSLRQTLGLRDLIFIVVGSIIGSGIFIIPAVVLRHTEGHLGTALLVWLVAGLLSLLGALTYGELGAARPDAGGMYSYIRDAFGPFPAFLYGWTSFFVIASGAVATLAVAFTQYLAQIVPVSPLGAKIVAVLMIAVIMVINIRGTRQSSDVQNWTTAIKLAAVVVMSVLLLALGHGSAAARASGATMPLGGASLLSAFGLAMIGVLWAYEGWQYVTFSAAEARDVQRTLPRGIIFGTALMIVIYLLANVAYVAALGTTRAMASERIAADAVSALFGPLAGKVIAAFILVSIFSAANGLTITTPRMYYAMARDGIFFRKLAEVHPVSRTPAFAIASSSVWAMILAATGTFEQLLTYVVFVGWIFYALAALSIFVFRRRFPHAERPFRVPGYPVTPVLFVLAAAALVGNTIVTQPRRAIVGIAIVAVGVPAYFVWRARRPEAAPARSVTE